MSLTVPVSSGAEAPAVIAERSGSTFYWPMLLLPRRKRRAMFAIYAFCRLVDDIADQPGSPEVKREQLAAWRARIRRLYVEGMAAGHADPITEGLASAIARFGLPRAELEAVIDGVAMDLSGMMRAPALSVLELYCRRVAGAVGLLAIRVFDRPDPAGETFAVALAEAMQFTNILRDLVEDSRLGRLYVPRELLTAAGIASIDPDMVLAHPNLPHACGALATRAERRYEEARAALTPGGARRLWAAWAMMILYRRLLTRLIRRGWHSPDAPVRLRKREQILVALRCAIGFLPAS
ncbi:MAG TPA: presqualene diphosphate synthase HpnD [Azospirillaceae bacterium]|nr:presqualene diphosphate synthase HpnD [Azospirillaceae bacterium]